MNARQVFTTKNVLIATGTIAVVGLAAWFGRGYIGFGKKDETGTTTVTTPVADVVITPAAANADTMAGAPEHQG